MLEKLILMREIKQLLLKYQFPFILVTFQCITIFKHEKADLRGEVWLENLVDTSLISHKSILVTDFFSKAILQINAVSNCQLNFVFHSHLIFFRYLKIKIKFDFQLFQVYFLTKNYQIFNFFSHTLLKYVIFQVIVLGNFNISVSLEDIRKNTPILGSKL